MKNIKSLKVLQDALAMVSKKRTAVANDNGTLGMTIRCHFDHFEEIPSEARAELDRLRIKEKLSPHPSAEKIKEIEAKLEALPKDQIMFVLKLEKPIDELEGTKLIRSDFGKAKGRTFKPRMQKVEHIYLPQDVYEGDYLGFNDTGDKTKDATGADTPIIDLILTNCILDVSKEEIDRTGRVWKQARAYVTNISFRSMQVVGTMLANEKRGLRNLWGTMGAEEWKNISEE